MRSLLGENCVDVPRFDEAYSTLPDKSKYKGGGFTVYGLLPDIPSLTAKRANWENEIDQYDLILITDIVLLWQTAFRIAHTFPNKKIALLDGSDSTALFPFESLARNLKKNAGAFRKSYHQFIYFKREHFPQESFGTLRKYIPGSLLDGLKIFPEIHPVAFSIPAEKITKVTSADKTKLFPTQIIDAEIAEKIETVFNPLGSDQRYFEIEQKYFKDLQLSKYGITGKRAGWDCMRHYELAANGSVICFKTLKDKPATCAPHGLNSSNCIDYNNYEDLMQKINSIDSNAYEQYLKQSYYWIENNTTVKRAEQILSSCFG
ncbi:MAG: glycosyltransferase family 1 protein [Bacteroidota bacterium]